MATWRKRNSDQGRAKHRADDERSSLQHVNSSHFDAEFDLARELLTNEALPGIEDFRVYMAEQNRKVEVAAYLDHIEGPQIVVHISRADGRITATLMAEITPSGIRPNWEVQSTGRFNTRWTERVRGGVDGLTRESVTRKLIELYLTDFS